MITPVHDLQARSFRALAHPARVAMLDMMRNGPICSCEIEPMLRLTQSNVAKHLAILRDSGLVSSYRDGSRVMCQVTDPRVFVALDAIRAAAHAQLEAVTQAFAAVADPLEHLEESTC
jgi:ArsR family transcriptional regulator